jgi:hypothetical protein
MLKALQEIETHAAKRKTKVDSVDLIKEDREHASQSVTEAKPKKS